MKTPSDKDLDRLRRELAAEALKGAKALMRNSRTVFARRGGKTAENRTTLQDSLKYVCGLISVTRKGNGAGPDGGGTAIDEIRKLLGVTGTSTGPQRPSQPTDTGDADLYAGDDGEEDTGKLATDSPPPAGPGGNWHEPHEPADPLAEAGPGKNHYPLVGEAPGKVAKGK